MANIQLERDMHIHFKLGGKERDSPYALLERVKAERGYSNKYVMFEKEWKNLKGYIADIDRVLTELNDLLCLPDAEQPPCSDHYLGGNVVKDEWHLTSHTIVDVHMYDYMAWVGLITKKGDKTFRFNFNFEQWKKFIDIEVVQQLDTWLP